MTAYTKHNIPKNISIEETSTHHQRKRIWEFHSPLKCPAVGICLSIDEHKRILKKCGCSIKGLSHYELHQTIMHHLSDENRISLKVDRFLNHEKQRTSALTGGISLLKTELRDARMRLDHFKFLNKYKKPDLSQKEKNPIENENRILRKKLNKPVKMLPQSSLSVVSRVLIENSTQQTPRIDDAAVQ